MPSFFSAADLQQMVGEADQGGAVLIHSGKYAKCLVRVGDAMHEDVALLLHEVLLLRHGFLLRLLAQPVVDDGLPDLGVADANRAHLARSELRSDALDVLRSFTA